ncbi:MAG TPA: type 1 glutamine amidotransferase domain-containing protein [Burkholderiales bacterium]
MATLDGMKVAVLVTDGFEQSELVEPRRALRDAGARSMIVSPRKNEVQGWIHFDKGDRFRVDVSLDAANSDDFDALVLPGGVVNPDQLRMQPKAVEFVKGFVDAGKPIAAICHGPWTLIDADAVRGRSITSWPSLRQDLLNAGAKWVDREVVADNGLVSSRKPADLPAFTRKMVEVFAEGRQLPQRKKPGRASESRVTH